MLVWIFHRTGIQQIGELEATFGDDCLAQILFFKYIGEMYLKKNVLLVVIFFVVVSKFRKNASSCRILVALINAWAQTYEGF